MKKFLLLSFAIMYAWAQEIIIIAHDNFPRDHLSAKKIKAIFLNKKRFIDGKKLLAINYEFNHPIRECFEREILKKDRRSLEVYWSKAHYKGKRPPKVIQSKKMLLSYLRKIDAAIGYIDKDTDIDKKFKVLYKQECQ